LEEEDKELRTRGQRMAMEELQGGLPGKLKVNISTVESRILLLE